MDKDSGSTGVEVGGWPAGLPVTRVRVARPTDHLNAVVRFYRDGLGLPVI